MSYEIEHHEEKQFLLKKAAEIIKTDGLKVGIGFLKHFDLLDSFLEMLDKTSKKKKNKKYDRVDVEADGKKELDYGSEELEKRWADLKKAALSSGDSIMEIASQEYHDEDEQSENPPPQSDQPQEEGEEEEPEEELEEGAEEPQEGEEEPEIDDHSQLEEMLREEGYSDAEIAYVVHNHMMPQATVDDIKMDGQKDKNSNDQAMADHELEHKKRMSDLEYDTASQEQGINELDKEHKKRMLDLEFDAAKREKEMELDFKRKELDLKLQGKKETQAVSVAAKKDATKSRQQDASKTSKKERKGK